MDLKDLNNLYSPNSNQDFLRTHIKNKVNDVIYLLVM